MNTAFWLSKMNSENKTSGKTMRTRKGKITGKVKDPNVRNPPDGRATTVAKMVTGRVTARRNGCEI